MVTLPPVVDIGLDIDRDRLQVGMPQLSLNVVERDAEVDGPDRMEMPKRVRGDHVRGACRPYLARKPISPQPPGSITPWRIKPSSMVH